VTDTTSAAPSEREQFEAHMRSLNPCVRLARQREVLGGYYRTTTVQRAWELWQAARRAQPTPPAVVNVAWKLGDALQDEQKKTAKLQAEIIRLRGLLRDYLRATTAHHQSPNDIPIQARYVRARDAALEALGDAP